MSYTIKHMPNSLISKIRPHLYKIILIKHLYLRNKLCPIDKRLRMAICQIFEHLIDYQIYVYFRTTLPNPAKPCLNITIMMMDNYDLIFILSYCYKNSTRI